MRPAMRNEFRLDAFTTVVACSARWREAMAPYCKGLVQFCEMDAVWG